MTIINHESNTVAFRRKGIYVR
uniref:Uncharacterized protein n=1 Tax=Rhizophora mucronata TaxID=61149 RepID=A0A2P2PN55_RHIMU